MGLLEMIIIILVIAVSTIIVAYSVIQKIFEERRKSLKEKADNDAKTTESLSKMITTFISGIKDLVTTKEEKKE